MGPLLDFTLTADLIFHDFGRENSAFYCPHTGRLWIAPSEENEPRLLEISGELRIPCILGNNGRVHVSTEVLRRLEPVPPSLEILERNVRAAILRTELH